MSTLLVDDSEIDSLVNRRLIELTNFSEQCIVTHSAEEALYFLQEECRSADDAPDWIFLDMYLPLMSGYDFIDEFKKLPAFITGKTRIIVLSVFQKQERLQKVFENKFVFGQLEKPLSQQALRNLAEGAKEKIIAFS
ncbi:MAG: response regulator [Bacteroidetes bacterium]|nr:response regulator [Bacteroidota bacterium]